MYRIPYACTARYLSLNGHRMSIKLLISRPLPLGPEMFLSGEMLVREGKVRRVNFIGRLKRAIPV